MEPSASLGYAPKPRWTRRRSFRRVLVGVILLAAIASGWRWGQPIYGRARLLWSQRQCLAFNESIDNVVYATDPQPNEFARDERKAFQGIAPACWMQMSAILPAVDGTPKNAEPMLNSAVSPLAIAPVYLHWRRSDQHSTRLVAVIFGDQVLNGKLHRVICCRVIDPATWRQAPDVLYEQSFIVASSFEWTSTVKMFAGQSDPSDDSHFVINVVIDGKRRSIDGWLKPDDKVELDFRN